MKTTKTLMTILTITLLIGGCGSNPMSLSSLPLLQASNIQQDTLPAITRTISVTGNAEVRVVPDEVILTLGAESFDKDLQAAKLENDKIIRKVFDIAKDLNIENKYIQTDYINIEPRYDTYINKRVLLGYAARKTIAITLKDISQFDLLLSSVLEAGVNYVHGIEFRTTELRIYRDQARALTSPRPCSRAWRGSLRRSW